MRIKILDGSENLAFEDMGKLWVEDIGSLPVMADVPMEPGGFNVGCGLNELEECQRRAEFRVSTADGAPGELWWYACAFCLQEMLRSSMILEVRR
ncbi:hypothetical protein SEA_XENIA2_50 [Gordonia phage Xenia2]